MIVTDANWVTTHVASATVGRARTSTTPAGPRPASSAKRASAPWGDLPGLGGQGRRRHRDGRGKTAPAPGVQGRAALQRAQGAAGVVGLHDVRRQGSHHRQRPERVAVSRHAQRDGGDQPVSVEQLTANIGQAQGLLYHKGSLYVSVNGRAAQGSGFYRVRDTDNDDQFDEVTLLQEASTAAASTGRTRSGSGRTGSCTSWPATTPTCRPACRRTRRATRTTRKICSSRASPTPTATRPARMAPGGWIVRTDLDGKEWELFCGGFRNAYDFDFNPDGELFTYDSDMEWDVGTAVVPPDAREPLRPAARSSAGATAAASGRRYYPDSLPAASTSASARRRASRSARARSSPRSTSGRCSSCDWSLRHDLRGAPDARAASSYTGDVRAVLHGPPAAGDGPGDRPGRGDVLHDRRAQHAVGAVPRDLHGHGIDRSRRRPWPTPRTRSADLRRKLEAFHGKQDPAAIDFAWDHLDSPDRYLRYAGAHRDRVAGPVAVGRPALAETRPVAATHALLALARCGPASYQPRLLERCRAC